MTCLISQYHTARCSLFGNCEGRGRLPISNLLANMVFRGTVLLSYPYFIANVEGDKPILTTLVLKYNFSGAYTNM